MRKGSTATVRATPVEDVSTAAGNLVVRAETVTVQTADRIELIDLTDRLAEFVRTAGGCEGVVSLWSMHTTCALFINETQAALHADIRRFLEDIVARDAAWMHNDPKHSDCDRMNADSHLRAMLLGHSLSLQVAAGELVLGHWQRVLAAELDGPRVRSFRVLLMGIGQEQARDQGSR
jgi:secondary thiamine-phosphate synthase enzyme